MPEVQIQLGAHTVDVYPQRHAYLTNRTTKLVQSLMGTLDTKDGPDPDVQDAQALLTWLGDYTYDALCVAIPTLEEKLPRHEFMGYATDTARMAGDYDESADVSPTFPEIETAFKTAVAVNRFDILKVLGQVFDLKLLKIEINRLLAQALSKRSANSPAPEGGASDQTTSGTTDPTSKPAPSDSPGSDSKSSALRTEPGTSGSSPT